MRIHLFVVSWEGKREAAEAIVSTATEADFRTVIYSAADERRETGTGEWLQMPNAAYFGLKFERALRAFHDDADVLLLVQADAVYADWNQVVSRCRTAFQDDNVGVWAPHVHHSWWTNQRVVMQETPIGSVVAQTDGIVFAFRRSTVKRLRRLGYYMNNLGWGVEWAAIAHAYTEGRLAYRDQTLQVYHPQGSGYDHRQARVQQASFLSQLMVDEVARIRFLLAFATRQQTKTALG